MLRIVAVLCLLSTSALADPAASPPHVPPPHPPYTPPPQPDLDKPLTGITLRKLNLIMAAQAAALETKCSGPAAQAELQGLIKQATP